MQNYHKQQQNLNEIDEKELILKTAAKLIKNDHKDMDTSKEYYPMPKSIEKLHCDQVLGYLPESLKTLLQNTLTGKGNVLKVAAIGQAITQASRQRSIIAPLQIALGVQMHHLFASKFLIDTLNLLGFCSSLTEVGNFEKSASVQGDSLSDIETMAGEFFQWAADNVDHNLATIDGKGTIHIMGLIETVTPSNGRFNEQKIFRKTKITSNEIAKTSTIDIYYYKGDLTSGLKFTDLNSDNLIKLINPTWAADLIWKTSLLFRVPGPSWLGTMQAVYKGNVDYPGKSETILMPMIDLDPNDLSCIYSTLKFVTKQARKKNFTAILTLDQPLFWKASQIVDSEKDDPDIKEAIIKIGGLHLEISFLGSIGHLMGGTGLNELLGCVYAENTVPHLLSGKAFSRAIRGHLLTSAALNALLMSEALGVPLPTESESQSSNSNDDTDISSVSSGTAEVGRTENNNNCPYVENQELIDIEEGILSKHPIDTTAESVESTLKNLDKIFTDLLNGDETPTSANAKNELFFSSKEVQ